MVLNQFSGDETEISPFSFGKNSQKVPQKPVFDETFVQNVFLTPFQELIGSFVSEKNSPQIYPRPSKLTLTREQIFSTIWPPYYIEYLRVFETIMKNEGFLSKEARFSFGSDEEIFAFLSQIIFYLHQKGVISEEEKISFQRGVSEELPALIRGEKKSLEDRFLEKKESSAFQKTFASLMEKIAYAFLLSSSAQAQFGGLVPGACLFNPFGGGDINPIGRTPNLLGDCYKDLDPSNLVCGPNLWAPCCSCSVGGVPVGCLNAVCATWPNAIWDEETGICGCG